MNAWAERMRALVLRFQDWLRAGCWSILLVGLTLRANGCCSGAFTGESLLFAPVSGPSAQSAAGVRIRCDFDVALLSGSPPSCTRMVTSARQNVFLALKVPHTGGAGQLVRGGAEAPKLVLRNFPSGGRDTAIELVPRDDLLPVINALLPIAAGEDAHWEALSAPSTYTSTWPCGRNQSYAYLQYALDFHGATCENCPVEGALVTAGAVDGLPFLLRGRTVLARFAFRIQPSASSPTPLVVITNQVTEAVGSGSALQVYHSISNRDQQNSHQLDLSVRSSLGWPANVYASEGATAPLTTTLLAAGASREVWLKTSPPGGAQGFDQIALTATDRDDARITYTVYDNVAAATDWWQAILLRWSFLPVQRRP